MKKYTKKEEKILTLITDFCQKDCCSREECPEEECVLFNIEQIIVGKRTKKSKSGDLVASPKVSNDSIPIYLGMDDECPECSLEQQVELLSAIGEETLDD